MPRLHSAVLQSLRNPGNAVLLNGLMDRDGTFNGNWKGPGGSSRYWSDAVNLKGREDLGAFAERETIFSRFLTLRPTRGATRQQRFRPTVNATRRLETRLGLAVLEGLKTIFRILE